ncbi:hypothetical protein B0H14DRAFT_866482 [Mycena olivaceomarginata]|nr:hypothetical protein B0H14DRAFT_866482 [Mycena olivaceomarginata]
MAGQRCRHHLFALPPRPRGRRRAPLPTPKHIALWAFSLFGRAAPVLLTPPLQESTARVSARGAPHTPTARTTSSRGVPPPPTETPGGNRPRPPRAQGDTPARRRARGGARYVHRVLRIPRQRDSGAAAGAGAQGDHRAVPAALRPRPDSLAHLQAADGEDAADLDGPAYARLTPWGVGGSQSQSRSSGRSSGSGSEIRSGWLYSPVGEIAYVGMPA